MPIIDIANYTYIDIFANPLNRAKINALFPTMSEHLLSCPSQKKSKNFTQKHARKFSLMLASYHEKSEYADTITMVIHDKKDTTTFPLASVAMSYETQSSWSHLPHTLSTNSRPVPSRASSVMVRKHMQHWLVSIFSLLVLPPLEVEALVVEGRF